MYAHKLEHKALMLRYNDDGVPRWEARKMRVLWPLVGLMIVLMY